MVGQGMGDDYAELVRENTKLKQENEALKRQLKQGTVQRVDPVLAQEIQDTEKHLQELYLKRRGRMVDDYYGWCSVCGQTVVAIVDGIDTCNKCLKRK